MAGTPEAEDSIKIIVAHAMAGDYKSSWAII